MGRQDGGLLTNVRLIVLLLNFGRLVYDGEDYRSLKNPSPSTFLLLFLFWSVLLYLLLRPSPRTFLSRRDV